MKKVFYLYLLILSFVSGNVIAQSIWDGSIDNAWPEDITQNELTISTPAQLARLAQLVNDSTFSFEGKTITLLSDINLNYIRWESIGRMEYSDTIPYYYAVKKPFRGRFNGNNKTIYNLIIEARHPTTGLFGYIENGARIENLTLNTGKINENGSVIKDHYTYCLLATGAFVGYVNCATIGTDKSQRDSVIIRNCHNEGVEVSSELKYNAYWKSYTSGIVGYVVGSNSSANGVDNSFFLIENCSNTAGVSGTYNTGGIIAGMDKINDVVIQSCKNTGEVKDTGKGIVRLVGGIVGYVNYLKRLIIDNCVNEGDIVSIEKGGLVSGILGDIRMENKQLTIKNSINKGVLLAGSEAVTGGIVGNAYIKTSGDKTINSLIVKSCMNIGEIDVYSEGAVGGILGKITVENNSFSENKITGTFILSNCYFASTLYASSYNKIGGLIGELIGSNDVSSFIPIEVKISNNYVTGSFEIEGDATIGGLVGVVDLIDYTSEASIGNNKPCLINNNLVVLTNIPEFYNSYRIIGTLKADESYKIPLSENYAYIEGHTWTTEIAHYKQNGEDWKGTMHSMPFSAWNGESNIAWDFDPADKFMPKLANVFFEQPDIPNPMYGKTSVGAFPVFEPPLNCSTSGNTLFIETTTPGDLSVYKFSGRLYNKRYIPAGLTTVQLPKDLYIVNFNGFSEKVVINR